MLRNLKTVYYIENTPNAQIYARKILKHVQKLTVCSFNITIENRMSTMGRITIFSLRKKRTGSLRVIMSVNDPKTRENQKKKVIMFADVHFSAPKKKQVQKKRSSRPQAVVCTEILQNFSWKNDLTCFHCS